MIKVIAKTDKNLIKNGMFFVCGDKHYIRIGKDCIEFTIDKKTVKKFDSIKEKDIINIFKRNGELLCDIVYIDEDKNN